MPGLLQCAENKRFSAFDDVYDDAEFNKSGNSDKSHPESERGDQLTTTTAEQGSSSGSSSIEKSHQQPVGEKKSESKGLSLLQWISETENQRSLRCMAENCAKELERFNEKNRDDLKAEIKLAVDAAQRVSEKREK